MLCNFTVTRSVQNIYFLINSTIGPSTINLQREVKSTIVFSSNRLLATKMRVDSVTGLSCFECFTKPLFVTNSCFSPRTV